jgi:hypothetical protein
MTLNWAKDPKEIGTEGLKKLASLLLDRLHVGIHPVGWIPNVYNLIHKELTNETIGQRSD